MSATPPISKCINCGNRPATTYPGLKGQWCSECAWKAKIEKEEVETSLPWWE